MSKKDKDEADMENQSPPPTEHEEIEMLLPWYVTGQLDSVEAKRVELYIEQHPEMSAQLGLVRDEMDVSIVEAEKLGNPPAGHLGTLMREIEKEAPAQASSTSGIFTKVSNWLGALEPRQMGFAAMAALALIVVQGMTIGGLMRGGGTDAPTYETASGPKEATRYHGLKFLVTFNPDARAADIEKFLDEINGSIVSGPKAGGLYEILVSTLPLNKQAFDEIFTGIKGRKNIVRSVLSAGPVTEPVD